jgi:hypothetical protein
MVGFVGFKAASFIQKQNKKKFYTLFEQKGKN